jgi:hypothetical protein
LKSVQAEHAHWSPGGRSVVRMVGLAAGSICSYLCAARAAECQSVSQAVSAIAALRARPNCTYEIGAFLDRIVRGEPNNCTGRSSALPRVPNASISRIWVTLAADAKSATSSREMLSTRTLCYPNSARLV